MLVSDGGRGGTRRPIPEGDSALYLAVPLLRIQLQPGQRSSPSYPCLFLPTRPSRPVDSPACPLLPSHLPAALQRPPLHECASCLFPRLPEGRLPLQRRAPWGHPRPRPGAPSPCLPGRALGQQVFSCRSLGDRQPGARCSVSAGASGCSRASRERHRVAELASGQGARGRGRSAQGGPRAPGPDAPPGHRGCAWRADVQGPTFPHP